MATNQNADNTQPLTFECPDGYIVELCQWAFVKAKLDALIVPLTSIIASENISLTEINNKLISWGPDNDEEVSS